MNSLYSKLKHQCFTEVNECIDYKLWSVWNVLVLALICFQNKHSNFILILQHTKTIKISGEKWKRPYQTMNLGMINDYVWTRNNCDVTREMNTYNNNCYKSQKMNNETKPCGFLDKGILVPSSLNHKSFRDYTYKYLLAVILYLSNKTTVNINTS